jgi:hypothetical protein
LGDILTKLRLIRTWRRFDLRRGIAQLATFARTSVGRRTVRPWPLSEVRDLSRHSFCTNFKSAALDDDPEKACSAP